MLFTSFKKRRLYAFILLGCTFVPIIPVLAKETPAVCEVAIIGTVHHKHLSDTLYPLETLERIINSYKPDLVLIEVSREELKNDDWSKTPPEMSHIASVSNKKGIAIDGFDEPPQPKEILPEELRLQLEKLRHSLNQAVGPLSFVRVHEAATDTALKKYYADRDLILNEKSATRKREIFMDIALHNILQKAKPKRALVFTGYTHRLHLQTVAESVCRRIDSPTLLPAHHK